LTDELNSATMIAPSFKTYKNMQTTFDINDIDLAIKKIETINKKLIVIA